VSPRRSVPRLADLSQEEVADLFVAVQRVGKLVERVYNASSLNIAIQDGADAGQSVPHVHTHIIPRQRLDLEDRGGSDAVYGLLEGEEGDVGKHFSEREGQRPKFPKVDEATRKPRTDGEMDEEAAMLRREMEAAKL
jgi:bis(5'-adenosyl)-triphosphatase